MDLRRRDRRGAGGRTRRGRDVRHHGLHAALALTLIAAFAVAVPAAASAYPGANGRIVFSGPSDGVSDLTTYELFTIRPDGSELTRLTFSPEGDVSPTWSPNGRLIAFESFRDGGNQSDLYTITPDGGKQVRLTNTSATESDASWSPDARNLVYQTNRYGTESIEILSLRDGSVRRVVTPLAGDHDPVWSSDGRWILFVRLEADQQHEIYKVHPSGRGLTGLTDNRHYDSAATWSPNAAKVAFMTNRDDSSLPTEIYVMRADGSKQRRITSNAVRDFEPGWSPDGRLISVHSGVFGASLELGNDDIYVMRPDGSRRAQLTFTPGNDQAAEWEPIPKACANRLPRTRQLRDAGTLFGDRILGGRRADRISGRRGDDCIAGGAGRDRLGGGAGRDRIDARDGEADVVACGPGRDIALLDGADRAKGCERRR